MRLTEKQYYSKPAKDENITAENLKLLVPAHVCRGLAVCRLDSCRRSKDKIIPHYVHSTG